jgi:hypothetical protein
MARKSGPKLTSADVKRLTAGTLYAKRGADFSSLDRLLERRLPEASWSSAHGDDLYHAGKYFSYKAIHTKARDDLEKAKWCFAAAYERLTQTNRDEALLAWADVLLEFGAAREKRRAIQVVRDFARVVEALSFRAATTLTLLSSGGSSKDIEENLAVAEEALGHWKDEIRDLQQAVREGKSMLREDVRMRKKMASRKRAAD